MYIGEGNQNLKLKWTGSDSLFSLRYLASCYAKLTCNAENSRMQIEEFEKKPIFLFSVTGKGVISGPERMGGNWILLLLLFSLFSAFRKLQGSSSSSKMVAIQLGNNLQRWERIFVFHDHRNCGNGSMERIYIAFPPNMVLFIRSSGRYSSSDCIHEWGNSRSSLWPENQEGEKTTTWVLESFREITEKKDLRKERP